MKRSIPPKTMRDVSRAQNNVPSKPVTPAISIGLGARIAIKIDPLRKQSHLVTPPSRQAFPTGLINKRPPRKWEFQVKPQFKKVKGPLVDVFHEAEEVLIVIDLGGFQRGDVSLIIKPEKYIIAAKQGDQEFREEILLPPEVDIENTTEHFRNGVLEIVLTRKVESTK